MNSISEIITQRRTIHDYRTDVVPDKQLILDALNNARWAPNHHLTEPWQFYILGEKSKEAVINLNTEIVREKSGNEAADKKYKRWSSMPGWLVITCNRSQDSLTEKEDYAACCCVVQNLMLQLWEKGIGMKWSTGSVIRDERFYDLLWIDAQAEMVVGLFWYGYPEIIPVTTRKPLEQTIIELP